MSKLSHNNSCRRLTKAGTACGVAIISLGVAGLFVYDDHAALASQKTDEAPANDTSAGAAVSNAPGKSSPGKNSFGSNAPASTDNPNKLRTLSLRASFDKAAESNKEVIAAKYNVPISRAAVKIASNLPNPRFNLLYGFGPAFTIILAGNPQQFGWQQQIQTAGKRSKNISLARCNLGLAELQVANTLFDVHNRVRRAYAELAAAEAYEDLIYSQRKIASELLRVSQRRFDSGKAAKSELLQAELGVNQFQIQLNQANVRLQQASVGLASIIGEVPTNLEVIDVDDNGIFKISAANTDLVPPPDRVMPSLQSLLPQAYSQRPDLRVAIQQAYADRKALTSAKAQRIPDLFVDTGYQFSTFKKHQPYNLFPGTVRNQPGVYLNANFELPIFYQHQGEVNQATATWLQDQDQIEQLETQIALDSVTSYEAAVSARANILKFQSELIPKAAEVAKIARRRYEVGKTDLATAIIATQQYQQILTSYFDSVVNYQNAWADLEKALGAPLQL
jgi:cobalt-zinc-cadmium efflux system outer membrane protein